MLRNSKNFVKFQELAWSTYAGLSVVINETTANYNQECTIKYSNTTTLQYRNDQVHQYDPAEGRVTVLVKR